MLALAFFLVHNWSKTLAFPFYINYGLLGDNIKSTLSLCAYDKREENVNRQKLIELYGYQKDECKFFLKHFYDNGDNQETVFLTKILKKNNDFECWDILSANMFIEDETFVSVYEKVKPNFPIGDTTYMRIFSYWIEEKKYDCVDTELMRVHNQFKDINLENQIKILELYNQEKFEESYALIEKVLIQDTHNKIALLYKVYILFLNKKWMDVILSDGELQSGATAN